MANQIHLYQAGKVRYFRTRIPFDPNTYLELHSLAKTNAPGKSKGIILKLIIEPPNGKSNPLLLILIDDNDFSVRERYFYVGSIQGFLDLFRNGITDCKIMLPFTIWPNQKIDRAVI